MGMDIVSMVECMRLESTSAERGQGGRRHVDGQRDVETNMGAVSVVDCGALVPSIHTNQFLRLPQGLT